MPTRLLKEDILFDHRVDALSAEAEVLYRRLMSKVDDFGRFWSTPQLIASQCYPFRPGIPAADVLAWRRELEAAGLVAVYEAQGKQVLEFVEFDQLRRAKASRFPDRDDANTCAQVPANERLDEGVCECECADVGEGASEDTSFDAFWSAYPAGPRKVNRKGCDTKWRAAKLSAVAADVMAGLARWKVRWAVDANKYVPQPQKFLGQRYWETDPGATSEPERNEFGPIRRDFSEEDARIILEGARQ